MCAYILLGHPICGTPYTIFQISPMGMTGFSCMYLHIFKPMPNYQICFLNLLVEFQLKILTEDMDIEGPGSLPGSEFHVGRSLVGVVPHTQPWVST